MHGELSKLRGNSILDGGEGLGDGGGGVVLILAAFGNFDLFLLMLDLFLGPFRDLVCISDLALWRSELAGLDDVALG